MPIPHTWMTSPGFQHATLSPMSCRSVTFSYQQTRTVLACFISIFRLTFVDSLLSTSKQYQWQQFCFSSSFVLTLKVSSHISKYKNYSWENRLYVKKKLSVYLYLKAINISNISRRYCFQCIIQLTNDICRRMLSKDQIVFLVQHCTCLHCKDPCKHN